MVAEEAKPSLLDLARASDGQPGPRCRFQVLLTDHARAAEIAELLSACGREIHYSTARDVLKSVGIDISADTISRHVRGVCSCPS